jgi:hypothetical protein
VESSEDAGFEAPRVSYVLNGKEVVMTGRTAIRPGRRTDHTIYEVKPIDVESDAPQFCKWVRMEELYEVQ